MTESHSGRIYLLHGLLETANNQYAHQIGEWQDQYEPIPVDLPGHGKCPVDGRSPYFATAIRYVTMVMERFGPGHVVAASYLGGPVAVRCALARPDLVRSLVLMGFVPSVDQEIFATWLRSFRQLADENPKLVAWYEKMHGERWQSTLEAYREDVEQRYTADVAVTPDMLAELPVPTLLANGSEKSNERDAAREASTYGTTVRGEVIEGAGHVPCNDRAEAFDRVLREFWKEVSLELAATSS